MWNEQKIVMEMTPLERVANFIGMMALAAMVTMIVLQWSRVPETIPAHFGANGEVDRWGSKWELLILPVIAIVLYLFMQFIEARPHTHNYPARLNDTNRAAFYLHSRRVINLTKNLCALLLAYTTWRTILVAKGAVEGLGMGMFSVLLVAVVGVAIWGAIKMSRIK